MAKKARKKSKTKVMARKTKRPAKRAAAKPTVKGTAKRTAVDVLLAPIIYAALLMVCVVAFLAVDGTLASGWDGFWGLAGFGVAFGYAYVILAEIGRLLLRPAPTAAAPATA